MKTDTEAKDLLRLLVPTEVKETLKKIANSKNTSLNNIGNLMLNQQLNRKPDLMMGLELAINQINVNQELLPQYRQLISSYTLLKLESEVALLKFRSTLNSDSFFEKGDRFMREAKNLVHYLDRQHRTRSF